MFVVCCLLSVVCCLLLVVVVCCLLSVVVCCLLFVVCCLLLFVVVCCLLFVVVAVVTVLNCHHFDSRHEKARSTIRRIITQTTASIKTIKMIANPVPKKQRQ